MSKIATTNSESRNFEVEQNFVIFMNFEKTKFCNNLQILKKTKFEVLCQLKFIKFVI